MGPSQNSAPTLEDVKIDPGTWQLSFKAEGRADTANSWNFEHIFSSECTNETIFGTTVRPVVSAALEGHHQAIIADGLSCSGKSYTMFDGPHAVIPSAVELLWSHYYSSDGQPLKATISYAIIEIYNNHAYDHLLASKSKPRARSITDTAPIVKLSDARRESFQPTDTDGRTVITRLRKASRDRQTGQTSRNETSSRGHLLLLFEVHPIGSGLKPGLMFGDLAGSETLGDDPSGDQISKSVNLSRHCFEEAVRWSPRQPPHTTRHPVSFSSISSLIISSLILLRS